MSEETIEVQEEIEEQETSEDEPMFTQRQLEDAVQARLGREKSRTKQARQEATASKAELDQLRAELQEYKHKDELRQWTDEVSKESGIPANVLRGDTKEELQAHAEALKALLKPTTTAPVISSEGASQVKTAATNDPIRDLINRRR